jgi:hypothetical protein
MSHISARCVFVRNSIAFVRSTQRTFDQYAPASDGTRFLVMNPIDNADQPPTLLVNWPALVKP